MVYVNPNFLHQSSKYYHGDFTQDKNMRIKSLAKNGKNFSGY